ncbi:MAG: SIMPL domain-containing protein [Eubacteriales bacterium]|nr:SIMPL domain-containing protein [Eubacteriales bacterium]
MAERFITIKGRGSANAKPDRIHLLLTLKTLDKNYEKMMSDSASKLDILYTSMEQIGIPRKDVKTTNFAINSQYESIRDKNNNWKQVFQGYCCNQNLKIELAFDMVRLGEALNVIAQCTADPELNIRFTVKDAEGMKNEVLRAAAKDARAKAELLAEASGVKLGQLYHINYSWGEIEVYSPTNYEKLAVPCAAAPDAMEIEPEDVSMEDTVTFTWEIEA